MVGDLRDGEEIPGADGGLMRSIMSFAGRRCFGYISAICEGVEKQFDL